MKTKAGMGMFNPQIDNRFSLLNPCLCQYHPPNSTFRIRETKKDGEADVTVTSGGNPCFHVCSPDKRAFSVLQAKRCADHLVFVFDPAADAWELHIFEMKRSISASKWERDVVPQFKGGMANACAILGILLHTSISQVYVHCCYRHNKSASSPVELRAPLGKPAPPDWLKEPVDLPAHPERYAANQPIKLDESSGAGSFQL